MWKLMSALLVNLILVIIFPYLLAEMEILNEIKDKSWLILGVTFIVVSSKTIMGDFISNKFEYHKHGYDFCVTSLGASMTALCLQLTSEINLFPELNQFPVFQPLTSMIDDPITLTITCLSLTLIASSFLMLLTARISKAITQDAPSCPDLLSLIGFLLGASVIGFYTLILITRA